MLLYNNLNSTHCCRLDSYMMLVLHKPIYLKLFVASLLQQTILNICNHSIFVDSVTVNK